MPFASLVPPVGILALDGLPLKSLKFSTFHGLSATPIASKPFHLVLSHKAKPLCPPPLALMKSLLEVFHRFSQLSVLLVLSNWLEIHVNSASLLPNRSKRSALR